ncbi:precorrin-3B C(17)-methyltransferase [Thermodesulforhabdus norvegica]|uniref:Cobalt-precorrin 3 C17-methyltransferase n=1 Tax=Thermodesulforhabdus norvegica TaxID=39841 RepID=A0A1I4W703_9BACT|nr:precorrin-3B C(17)-methyltransferase [Thermodesulforhabdus norvegica]SFN09000.1 cobalt-precorrin 3 C17-methyltransferase [Thermodesulforhabdus norvegica]
MSLGPGFPEYMIPEAREALDSSDLIVGYSTYVSLIKPLYPDKTFLVKGMRQELQRVLMAIEEARKGKRVSLVSGGDVGIYGMAGLVFDVCRKEDIAVAPFGYPETDRESQEWELSVRIVPGVSALNAAAAVLGAPLMHDFATISLSDHLTPWSLIEKRIHAAAMADFVIVFYNPRSKTRPKLLDKALSIVLEYRSPETPAGIVKRAMRDGQERIITKLESIVTKDIDMQTILIIGNARTYVWRGWMVTPRGYDEKYLV